MVWWLFKKREDKLDRLHKNLEHSFSNLKIEMGSAGKWINHFKEEHKKHNDNLGELFKRIENIENQIVIMNERIREQIKEHLEHSIAIERVQSFNRSDQSFMNVQSDRSIDNLTPAQKQVLALLVMAGGPLDYEDIANKLRLNIVTIRRHVNDMKRTGVGIKEKVSVKNRRKLIYIDEKIRDKLITLEKKKKSKRED